MDEEFWLIVFTSAMVCGIIGSIVGSPKQAGPLGFLLGCLFGPLGVIATFAIDKRRECPKCHGKLDGTPAVCTHCRQHISWPDKISAVEVDDGLIHFQCGACGNQLIAPPDMGGTLDKCGKCRREIAIPVRGSKPAREVAAKLIDCDDCGAKISRRATSCPQCGCPISV